MQTLSREAPQPLVPMGGAPAAEVARARAAPAPTVEAAPLQERAPAGPVAPPTGILARQDKDPLAEMDPIADLERSFVPGGDDAAGRLAKLEADAEAKKQQVGQQVDKQNVEVEQQAKQAKTDVDKKVEDKKGQVAKTKEQVKAKKPGLGAPTVDHQPVQHQPKAPATKQSVLAKLDETLIAETAKIDEALTRDTAKLDESFQGKLQTLEKEEAAELATVDKTLAPHTQSLDKDITAKRAAQEKRIAAEAKTHDEKTKAEVSAILQQGTGGADTIRQEGKDQAKKTRDTAKDKAAETRARAKEEAANARNVSENQANAATTAAESRAATITDPAEKQRVLDEGKRRAEQARALDQAKAEAAATSIEQKGETAAAKLETDGETKAKAIETDSEAKAKAHEEKAKESAKKVEAERAAAREKMGLAAMDGELDQRAAANDVQTQMSAKKDDVRAPLAAARQKLEDERKTAVAEMTRKAEAAKQQLREKIDADKEKVGAAKDTEIEALDGEVDKDVAALEKQTEEATKAIEEEAKAAEKRVANEVAQRSQEIQQNGRKALAAIDGFVREARKKINDRDAQTTKEVADAARKGSEQIEKVGTDEFGKNVDSMNGDLQKVQDAGRVACRDLEKDTTKARREMVGERKKLEGEITGEWVREALMKAKGNLKDGALSKDEDVQKAMNTMASLPPEQLGEVMKDLPAEQYMAVYEDYREVVITEPDPEKRLALWGGFHKARAHQDHRVDHDAPPANLGGDAAKIEQYHKTLDKTLESTEKELYEEQEFLDEQKRKGKPISNESVDDLIDRKQLEHEIERKYDVNVTNEEGARPDDHWREHRRGQKIVWTRDELEQLDSSMSRTPEKDRVGMKEFYRGGVAERGGNRKAHIGGEHPFNSGTFSVYDMGVDGVYRHTGAKRELDDPSKEYGCPRCGAQLTGLEETISHEMGHEVHDRNRPAFDEFAQAAGWKGQADEAALKTQFTAPNGKLSEEEAKAKIEQINKGDIVTIDGKQYRKNPMHSPGHADPLMASPYLEVRDGGIAQPGTGPGAPLPAPNGGDTWSYARTNAFDNFAEVYQKAIHTPETLHHDMMDAPKKRVELAGQAVTDAQSEVDKLAADPAATPEARKAAEDKLKEAQTSAADAAGDAEAQKKQYEIMRNKVFNAQTLVQQRAAAMRAANVPEDKVKAFEAEAAKAFTPQQIAGIAEKNGG